MDGNPQSVARKQKIWPETENCCDTIYRKPYLKRDTAWILEHASLQIVTSNNTPNLNWMTLADCRGCGVKLSDLPFRLPGRWRRGRGRRWRGAWKGWGALEKMKEQTKRKTIAKQSNTAILWLSSYNLVYTVLGRSGKGCFVDLRE